MISVLRYDLATIANVLAFPHGKIAWYSDGLDSLAGDGIVITGGCSIISVAERIIVN